MSTARRIALPLLALALAAAPADASLRAYWNFDGCTLTDGVATRNLSMHGSPACVTGVLGNAWSLDGISQYLDRANETYFAPGSAAFSVAAWAKRSNPADTTGAIVSWYRCGANPSCGTIDSGLWALWDLSGHAAWDLRDDAVTALTLRDSTVNIGDGQWHLLVGTLNASHTLSALYVDGTLRKSKAIAMTSISGSPPLEIGRWFRTGWGTPDSYYAGAIDEVRIYDEELTPAAVAALYAARAGVAPGTSGASLTLDRIAPNPVRASSVRVEFSLVADAPAQVELLDLLGRRVATERVANPTAGRHTVTFDGHGAFPPGVYLVRVSQGAATTSRRVTLLR